MLLSMPTLLRSSSSSSSGIELGPEPEDKEHNQADDYEGYVLPDEGLQAVAGSGTWGTYFRMRACRQ